MKLSTRESAHYFSARLFRRLCAILLCATALFVATRPEKIHAANSVLLGDQTIESTRDSDSTGSAEAFQAIATASGTVGSLSVYVDTSSSATRLIVGLYSSSSGNPKTLLSQGSSTTTPTSSAWNTVTIPPVAVTANTTYWIAILGTGGTLRFRDGATNCLSASSTQTTLSSLPASWTTGHTWASCRLSAYGSANSSNPILSLSSTTLSFTATQGGANPASQSVNVTNTGGGGALSFSATSDSSWLSVATGGGTTPGSAQISAKVGTLTPATYTGHVTVTATGAQGSPATIIVTFNLAAQPVLSLSQTSLSFSATQGGANPASQSANVTNTGGGGTLSFSASSDSSWLTVATGNGTTPGSAQISAKLGTLTPATYTGHVTVTATGAQGSPATITVTFNVTSPQPQLSLLQTSLSFSATQGGADPAPQSVNVTNTGGGGALSFSAASDSSWLSVTIGSGTTPGTAQISAKVGTLTPATYTGHVTVTGAGAQGSPATITVTFNVATQPVLSLSQTSLSFSATQGGANPASQSVNVTNTGGGGTLSFSASSDSSWLTVATGSGTTPGAAQISAKMAGLTPATYTGTITVSAAGVQNSPTITVTFDVAAQPVLSFSTTSLSFNAVQGSGTNPVSQSVNVANTGGGGALSFSASSDSSWLTVTTGGGTTPGALNISAALGAFPVGTYTGNINVTAAGAQESPAVIAVTFVVAPILGDSTLESSLDTVSSGQAQAVQFSATATGSVNALAVYLDSTSTASRIYAGIYADNGSGHPGALLGQGNLSQGAGPMPVGWNNIAISTGNVSAPNVPMAAGALYWIAIAGTQGGAAVYRAASAPVCSSETSFETNLTVLPASWTTGGAGSACPASVFGMLAVDISGTISGIPAGGASSVVTLTGSMNGTTTTDGSGNYSFSASANATYTVAPSNASFTLTPASRMVSTTSSSIGGVNFAALYSISGNVGGGAGTTVALSGSTTGSTTTDSSGNYSFSGLANGTSYIITPSNIAYTFAPVSQSGIINLANVTGVSFTASAAPPGYPISGTITLSSKGAGAGAIVTLTAASTGATVASTVADSTGNFSLTGVPNGSYVVTPSSDTAVFTPTSIPVTINGSGSTATFKAATLIFYDDFTGTSLSPAWTVISRHGEYAQNETECNIPQMVSVANGLLTITTEQTPNPDPQKLGYCGDFNTNGTVRTSPTEWPYITGDVQWKNLNFTYGTIEIRAKFPPSATNTWPATWLLGSNCQLTNIYSGDVGFSGCPSLGASGTSGMPGYYEIDMTECYNSGGWCQFHVANPSFFSGVAGCDLRYPVAVDTNFHTFKTVWDSVGITQYMDGVAMNTACKQKISNPMFLILQTQTSGGSPGVDAIPNNTQLPTTFTIDYVKVTQP